MRTAVFGGSFDPIHNGHIDLLRVIVDNLALDRSIIIPAFVSPFKTARGAAAPEHRLEMCRLAFAGWTNAIVSDIELRREGASYTCDTLTYLSEMYPEDELFLITGADAFLTIQSWRSPEVIFSKATVCTIPRNGDDATRLESHSDYLKTLGARTAVLDVRVMAVSSTEIRERIRNCQSINGLVPDRVERYILSRGLYTEVSESDDG